MSEIKPALTPEEWAGARSYVAYWEQDRHAIAAACMDGQPFGFTWEDVETLEMLAGAYRLQGDAKIADRLWSLSQRIAALLPPQDEHP